MHKTSAKREQNEHKRAQNGLSLISHSPFLLVFQYFGVQLQDTHPAVQGQSSPEPHLQCMSMYIKYYTHCLYFVMHCLYYDIYGCDGWAVKRFTAQSDSFSFGGLQPKSRRWLEVFIFCPVPVSRARTCRRSAEVGNKACCRSAGQNSRFQGNVFASRSCKVLS